MITTLIHKIKERNILSLLKGFSFVGAGVTLLSFVLLYIFIDVFKIPLVPAYILVYVLTILLSYYLNVKYVFKGNHKFAGGLVYFGVYLSGMFVGICLLELFKLTLPLEDWILSYMVIPFTFMWNFLLSYKFLKNGR